MWLGVGWGRLLARYEKRGGGGGGCCRFMARYKEQGGVLSVSGPIRRAGGWGGRGAVGFWPDTKSGEEGNDRVSGSPGYTTVGEFMRAAIMQLLL